MAAGPDPVKQAASGRSGPGWDALASADYESARAWFEAEVARAESALALEGLSWVAFAQDDAERLFWARERAHRLYRQAGDILGAARMALWVAEDYQDFKGEYAIGNGWRQRARSLLQQAPPAPEHGWLDVLEAEVALLVEEDAGSALDLARRAVAVGRAHQDADLEAAALAMEGLAFVTRAEIEPGMARLDEAGAITLAGDLREPFTAGWVMCCLLFACERAADYDRATEWCERLRRYADEKNVAVLKGVCRAHYAGVLIWRGKWSEAEEELSRAQGYFEASRPPLVVESVVRLADLRRRQGRLDEAAEIFSRIEFHPLALLGLAQMALDAGRLADAAGLVDRALRHVPENSHTQRFAALALLARVEALQGNAEAAARAATAVEEVAGAIASRPLRGSAHLSSGLAAAARGDHGAAIRLLEDAVDAFDLCGGPYEAARARLELARSLLAAGRAERAAAEARAAQQTFESLGAAVDLSRTAEMLREIEARPTSLPAMSPLTPRQVDIMRLVARGLSDREIAAELVLSEHTVHRHIANILQRLDLPSRAAAAAYAGRAGLL